MMRAVRATAVALSLLVGQSVATATAYASDVCAEFGGAIEQDGLCRVHQTNPNYTLDMSFPVDYPDQAAVDDFLTQTRTGFLNETKTPNFANTPYALDMKASPWASDTTRSVSFEIYENFGGAHPNTWYKTFNYDTVRSRTLTFADLFAPGVNPLNTIFPIVQRKLEAELGMPAPVLDDAGTNPANYQNFAITPTDVVFFFDRGGLMPGAAGAQTVYVPRTAIPPLAV
jgi:uncharacterized protein DUF3298